MQRLIALIATLLVSATAWGAHDGRIRVEIPLRDPYIGHGATLKLNKLIQRRTDVDPRRFELRAVIMEARSHHDGHAQLTIGGRRSAAFHIPDGHRRGLSRIRIPAPRHADRGHWRLRVSGGTYIDRLVAVLEPRYGYRSAARHPAPDHSRWSHRHDHGPRGFDVDPGAWNHHGALHRHAGPGGHDERRIDTPRKRHAGAHSGHRHRHAEREHRAAVPDARAARRTANAVAQHFTGRPLTGAGH